MKQQRKVQIDKENLTRRAVAWHTSDHGRCWWIYQYLSAPPFKPVKPLEVGFAQKDSK